jgi:alpha-glucosidase
VLRTGEMTHLRSDGDLAIFQRAGEETLFCAFNLGSGTVTSALPEGNWDAIATDLGAVAQDGATIALGPWDFCILKKT